MFYIAQYPVCWTTQSALHFTPRQTCSFRQQLYLSGKNSATLSIAGYLFIQLSELGCRGQNKNARASKREQRGSDSLD